MLPNLERSFFFKINIFSLVCILAQFLLLSVFPFLIQLNEGENVASAARTDVRESGIHLHRSSGYEVMHENHMGVSSRENLSRADSCHSLRKIEARPIALDNIGKWKSRNSSSNGSRTEGSPRGSTQLVLKACSLCGTTKTPMWRSGPQGPKVCVDVLALHDLFLLYVILSFPCIVLLRLISQVS